MWSQIHALLLSQKEATQRSYHDWTTFWGQWQLLLLSMLFHEKNCKEAFWNFSSFMQKIIWGKLCIFFPSDSLLLQQTSAMVHLQQNYANQMMLTHSYVVIHVARSCNNSSLLSSDDFPHEKWEFPRPSLKFFSWKSMFNNNNRRPQKISLVWYSLCLGGAKETAPVINIEINGVRGIWLTFLEWDIFLEKNWTDILYQKRFEQTFAVRSYHEFLPQNWSLSAQSSY